MVSSFRTGKLFPEVSVLLGNTTERLGSVRKSQYIVFFRGLLIGAIRRATSETAQLGLFRDKLGLFGETILSEFRNRNVNQSHLRGHVPRDRLV